MCQPEAQPAGKGSVRPASTGSVLCLGSRMRERCVKLSCLCAHFYNLLPPGDRVKFLVGLVLSGLAFRLLPLLTRLRSFLLALK